MNALVILIGAIVIVSATAFSQPQIFDKYKFNAYQIVHRKEYIRLLSHGFLHGSWTHLLVNMFVLYSFGRAVIYYFDSVFPGRGQLMFLLLFFSSLIFSSLYSLFKEKDNVYYSAVGASGAVSAVLFTSIFFAPYNLLYLFAVIPIPGIVFGVAYLIYTKIMAKKNIDNIGHDAHFWGAVFGFVFPLIYKPSLFMHFISELLPFI
ncbi:Membrane associated serine protease, rhomboid family [Saccharicrinis carchari]|uniref:Membrane associated serine protease, rhomboid family n=1 Tax=Saccharicrinis carchari TaxID=1168039 RepID=A0A521CJW3_SACCC|nr:rhomboid family intramembrane serine protease [Saccharicrinis carchari]SMO59753.1 Membrane associated serine protease, rhomboid family [Saccharicrinis carchari]